jgi:hypothetical protein
LKLPVLTAIANPIVSHRIREIAQSFIEHSVHEFRRSH